MVLISFSALLINFGNQANSYFDTLKFKKYQLRLIEQDCYLVTFVRNNTYLKPEKECF